MQIPPSIFASVPQASARPPAGTVNWADAPDDESSMSAARADFSKYMKMTPAEKMHAAMLAQMGVSEEEYKAMSPDERAALDQKIAEKIKQQVQDSARDQTKPGLIADVTV